MKSFSNFRVVLLLVFCFITNIAAQDDEARQQNGLPTMIGNRPGNNPAPGSDATVSGTLVIQGLSDETKAPVFTVAVLANGVVVAKQRIKNGGSFNFNGVPRNGITLIVEADGLEIANYPMGTLTPPPLPNRRDLQLTWLQVGPAVNRQNEVISVRNSYQRSEENQKLFAKAVDGLKEKKTENSLKLFKQLVEKDPDDFVAWTELGNLCFTGEKLTDAENSYQKALALKNDFLPALTNLGKLYLSQKNFDRSIEILTKALAADPQSADINHYLGEAYLQSRQGSKAVIYLNEAVRLAPIEKAEIHLRLAALYNAAGAKERAAAEYKMFLEKVPNYPDRSKLEKYISENSPK